VRFDYVFVRTKAYKQSQSDGSALDFSAIYTEAMGELNEFIRGLEPQYVLTWVGVLPLQRYWIKYLFANFGPSDGVLGRLAPL
jgi:hypothetical protein